ncbi:MAG: hypothetical protein ACREE4_22500 [Stellaceae bacterium]
MGRKTIGTTPMTAAERQRRRRAGLAMPWQRAPEEPQACVHVETLRDQLIDHVETLSDLASCERRIRKLAAAAGLKARKYVRSKGCSDRFTAWLIYDPGTGEVLIGDDDDLWLTATAAIAFCRGVLHGRRPGS